MAFPCPYVVLFVLVKVQKFPQGLEGSLGLWNERCDNGALVAWAAETDP